MKNRLWRWDDGSILPTYNTQHYATHSDGLFLVYTRIADNNGHVFQHRAPLFVLRWIGADVYHKETERILVPERGARLGNFQVTNVTPGKLGLPS